ncbi:hypothetical protein OS493_007391 [Desmophyllum pertusum]|uniref:Major facilitator superfamily (MFS) profile domain-containing protein n=1 Tax=Desmophyllum pertusum TaxID=174260 RepID=A0A9W9Z3K0_9CNID|nr:hypothetical protein OS493_007391 [Desmophyllum pertusum]
MTNNPTFEAGLHIEETHDHTETAESSNRKLRQPDTYWSWVVCAAGVTCNIIVLGCGFCYGILFPSLLDEFKKGKSDTAWVGSLTLTACGLCGPVAGRLTDRFGARAMVICGALLCAAGLLFTSLVPSLYLMFLTYGGMYGFGSSLVFIAVYAIVPRYFVKRRSLAIGLITVSAGASLLVMSPVCQALLDAFGWRGAFRGLGCIVLIVFLIGWALDPNVASEENEEVSERSKTCKARQSGKILDFSMWTNITFVAITISSSVVFIGHYIPMIHLSRYCEDLGIAADLASWLYSCIGAASLLARIPGSKLCDVFGPQRVFLVSSAASAVGAILFPFATNWTGLICLSIIYGIGDGLMAIGSIMSVLCTLSPTQKAQGFGFYELCVCVNALCGPPIGGWMADKTNSYHAAFFFAGGIKVVGVVILVVFNCLIRRHLSQEKIQIDTGNSSLAELLVVEKVTVL